MSQINITKGKILKKKVVEISYIKNDDGRKSAKGAEEFKDPPHKDLLNAFASLAIHAALKCDFIPYSEVKDIENVDPALIKNFSVTGFTIIDDEGIIITARKTLKDGTTMGFNTTEIPLIEDEEKAKYPQLDNLVKCVGACTKELILYIGGKYGNQWEKEEDKNALKIEFPEHEEEPVEQD